MTTNLQLAWKLQTHGAVPPLSHTPSCMVTFSPYSLLLLLFSDHSGTVLTIRSLGSGFESSFVSVNFVRVFMLSSSSRGLARPIPQSRSPT
jgi:hypothetical protein